MLLLLVTLLLVGHATADQYCIYKYSGDDCGRSGLLTVHCFSLQSCNSHTVSDPCNQEKVVTWDTCLACNEGGFLKFSDRYTCTSNSAIDMTGLSCISAWNSNGACSGAPSSISCTPATLSEAVTLKIQADVFSITSGCDAGSLAFDKCVTPCTGHSKGAISYFYQFDAAAGHAVAGGGDTASTTAAAGGKVCSSVGDPHYTTFDGNYFDFYGVGEYWLTKGSELEVQARHESLGSVSANVAIAVGGSVFLDDKIIITATETRINGIAKTGDGSVGKGTHSISTGKVVLEAEGFIVAVHAWRKYLNVHVTASNSARSASSWTGLCEQQCSGSTCATQGREGRRRGSGIQAQQISKNESIFDYADKTYESANAIPVGYTPSDGCATTTLEGQAKEACAKAGDMVDFCVRDVCATGDLASAEFIIQGSSQRAAALQAANPSSAAAVTACIAIVTTLAALALL